MVKVSREELIEKAKAINTKIFGRTMKKKVKLGKALQMQVQESIKFALDKAFQVEGIPKSAKKGFLELLKEQKGAINILLINDDYKGMAIQMLQPMFGEKSEEFVETFLETFRGLQNEINLGKKSFSAA